uniref:Uncharacterized protein n=1 Tax=Physcomitrium patens TaxID=3218 RepID=A0A2K1K1M9_PHYPA|nr:hypothetical protein PHYPA_012157 [Physcomitrium patens]
MSCSCDAFNKQHERWFHSEPSPFLSDLHEQCLQFTFKTLLIIRFHNLASKKDIRRYKLQALTAELPRFVGARETLMFVKVIVARQQMAPLASSSIIFRYSSRLCINAIVAPR